MLKTYQQIQPEHKIFGAHKLIEYLVKEIWCKADENNCYDKLTDELKLLYDNPKSDWFKTSVDEIYRVSKDLTADEKETLSNCFSTNNNIKGLCDNPNNRKQLDLLNTKLEKVIVPFFKELYKKLLSWEHIKSNYGSKKSYYDDLIAYNDFKFCPCCGYGQIKTIYDPGHSAFDHYLPLKHYPFSAINFNNLIPLCDVCNSSYKGETDILKKEKQVFYPLDADHPEISVDLEITKDSFKEVIIKRDNKDTLVKKHIKVSFNIDNEKVNSWDSIFGIKTRYFGEVANNRGSWLNDVRKKYRKPKIDSYDEAFDEIIEDDSNKHLGFLKSPFLSKMKTFSSLIDAFEEVSGDYVFNKNKKVGV